MWIVDSYFLCGLCFEYYLVVLEAKIGADINVWYFDFHWEA